MILTNLFLIFKDFVKLFSAFLTADTGNEDQNYLFSTFIN